MSADSALSKFGDVFEPAEAQEPILAPGVRNALTEWLTEIWAEKELADVGIAPRKRAIFDGAPGTGKTTLAHHLAARLGLAMLAARPDRLISKYVGETGRNIGELFHLLANLDEPILLFLDEFDTLSPQRRKSEQAADDSRNDQVNTLLQRLEQHNGFLIAATNFAGHIDPAMWRRFDIHITLTVPGPKERERIIARYLQPFVVAPRALAALSDAMDTASPALIRAFCEGLKRQQIVGPKLNLDMRKESVVDRLITAIHPHPDLGKPRLWDSGGADDAVKVLPWPLTPQGAGGKRGAPA